ncbi:MAG: ATP-binding protein [Armatimonadetes bacterium]|nr:ATP-binding protein [Armatimonadota bacterium]
MSERGAKLEQILDAAERVGVVGSPSSTAGMALDILAGAVNKKLVGELALFRFLQEGLSHCALGQITEVRLRNVWHEDPTMRSLIRQRGRVDAVSERQDTHQGDMTISAVFSADAKGYRPSILGTVPATGTPIHLANDDVLQELLSPYRDELFYLGHVYGSKPLLPLWFKHFDSGPQGAGEAYHLGIFGKTGSGKSVLAKMILLAYARYPGMAILIIDPQGEFAKEVKGEQVPGEFQLPTKQALTQLGKPMRVYGVRNLVLDRWELFAQILSESPFFEQLSIPKGENRQLAADALCDRLERAKVTLKDLHSHQSFERAWTLLGDENVQKVFYRTEGSRARFQSMYDQADKDLFYRTYWLPVAQLFRQDRPGAQRVDRLLEAFIKPRPDQRPLLVVDLSAEQAAGWGTDPQTTPSLFPDQESGSHVTPVLWNETIQALVIKRLLEGIRTAAEGAYKENRSLNTLVLMDEAHRLAPREDPDTDEKRAIRGMLIDAARTTRKQGVGWMFISQTLSSLHRDIVDQLRIFFLGFGLGMGTEYRALSEMVGGRSQALELYKLFRDPHSSFDTSSREYSFMTIGPVSPLSFAGTPLFLNAFNSVEEFLMANGLKS